MSGLIYNLSEINNKNKNNLQILNKDNFTK